MNRSLMVVVGLIAAAALFGGGYAIGASRTASSTTATTADATGASGARGALTVRPGGGAAGGNVPLSGRVISVNADSITIAVSPQRGPGQGGASASPAQLTSSIVLVGGATRIVRTAETEIKLTDLKANDQITVVGQTDATTGTVSAQTVVVGGTGIGGLFGGGGAGGGGNAPRPSPSPAR